MRALFLGGVGFAYFGEGDRGGPGRCGAKAMIFLMFFNHPAVRPRRFPGSGGRFRRKGFTFGLSETVRCSSGPSQGSVTTESTGCRVLEAVEGSASRRIRDMGAAPGRVEAAGHYPMGAMRGRPALQGRPVHEGRAWFRRWCPTGARRFPQDKRRPGEGAVRLQCLGLGPAGGLSHGREGFSEPLFRGQDEPWLSGRCRR